MTDATIKRIKSRLQELKKDERIAKYPSADVFTNAPLALEQVALGTKINTLEWVLELPLSSFPFKNKRHGK